MSEWQVPPAQPEGIDWKIVIGALVGTLLLFGGAVLVIGFDSQGVPANINPGGPVIPQRLARERQNLLRTVPFAVAAGTYRWQQQQRERLASYGWVSRARNVIHIPVDEAIDQMLAEGPGAFAPPPQPEDGMP